MVYRAAITAIHADAADDDHRNLNGEYALVGHTGRTTTNLGRWRRERSQYGPSTCRAAGGSRDVERVWIVRPPSGSD